jgi:hypothetical protein
MGISDSAEPALTLLQRCAEVIYSLVPALIGLFMILWGFFLNGGDWILIGVGLALFLGFGWYTVQAIRGK